MQWALGVVQGETKSNVSELSMEAESVTTITTEGAKQPTKKHSTQKLTL